MLSNTFGIDTTAGVIAYLSFQVSILLSLFAVNGANEEKATQSIMKLYPVQSRYGPRNPEEEEGCCGGSRTCTQPAHLKFLTPPHRYKIYKNPL